MSDYTPSTDEMRDIYTWDRCVKHGRDDSLDTRTFREDFDRWLESVRAEERERIARNIASENVRHWREHRATAPVYRNGYDEAMTDAARIAREGA